MLTFISPWNKSQGRTEFRCTNLYQLPKGIAEQQVNRVIGKVALPIIHVFPASKDKPMLWDRCPMSLAAPLRKGVLVIFVEGLVFD